MGKSYSVSEVDNSAHYLESGSMMAAVSGSGNKVGTSDFMLGDGASYSTTTTDLGAIAKAFDFGTSAQRGAFDFGNNALASVGDLAKAQGEASQRTTEQIGKLAEAFQSNGESRTQNTVLMIAGIGATVLVVGIIAYAWSESK